MVEDLELPTGSVAERRTPVFDVDSLPPALTRAHRTAVWARLQVETGSVRYMDLQGDARRDVQLDAGDSAVIAPNVEHRIEPSQDARFFVQFYRASGGATTR